MPPPQEREHTESDHRVQLDVVQSTLHGSTLQARSSVRSSQLPPMTATSVMWRLWVLVPPPQVAVQSDQPPHSVTVQLAAQD
jgi:hypothetical protein